MTSDPEDIELVTLYRATTGAEPNSNLDRWVLSQARASRRVWRLSNLPQVAAASLVVAGLALISLQHAQTTMPAELNDATYGLHDGQATAFLMDAEAMKQSAVRQVPGGAN